MDRDILFQIMLLSYFELMIYIVRITNKQMQNDVLLQWQYSQVFERNLFYFHALEKMGIQLVLRVITYLRDPTSVVSF